MCESTTPHLSSYFLTNRLTYAIVDKSTDLPNRGHLDWRDRHSFSAKLYTRIPEVLELSILRDPRGAGARLQRWIRADRHGDRPTLAERFSGR